MTPRTLWPQALLAVCAGALLAGPLEAAEARTRAELLRRQREAKAERLEPQGVSKLEERLTNYENRPLHAKLLTKGYSGLKPLYGGMPSGSGLVIGAAYNPGFDNPYLRFELAGRWSTRRYKALTAHLDFPPMWTEPKLSGFVHAGYHDHTSLRFFGLGTDPQTAKTHYRSEGRELGGGARFKPHRRFEVWGTARLLNLRIDPSSQEPSLDALFDPASVPGFDEQPEFVIYGGHFKLDLHDRELPRAGASLELGVQRYDDREADAFTFTRVIGDLKLHVPLGTRNRRLALRLRTSHSSPDSGAEVPFYLMETVGGAKNIRGFNEYRFRDRRNLVINAEYRWEVWNYLDMTLFADAGKTFRDRDDFNFSDLHVGYGVGLRLHTPRGGGFRVDLARSEEGFKLHLSGGPSF